MSELLKEISPWLGGAGWGLICLGFFLQRKALQEVRNQVRIKGNHNVVTNTVHQSSVNETGGESALAWAASWASILGLVLSALPLLTSWFGRSA